MSSRKITGLFATIAMILMLAPAIHAQTVRHGTIVELTPIENRGADETDATKTKRKIGGFLGQVAGTALAVKGGAAGAAVGGVAPQVGENAAAKIGDQGPSAHYMVKLKLDTGKVVSTTQRREDIQGLSAGSRVSVTGTGGDIQLQAE
jgi:outer membrane lipoprotein SlyB